MNGIDFVADTNFLIYLLTGHPRASPYADNAFAVSVITEMELLGQYGIASAATKTIRQLLNDCLVLDLSPAIKHLTITLRQQHRIKLPDAIVAASAQ